MLASLSGARESARDTRRASDFDQLRTAMQMYFNDNGSYAGGGDTGGVRVSSDCNATDIYTDLVDGGYLNEIITDPVDSPSACDDPSSSEPFYGWDSANIGGDFCFSINKFESGSVPDSLQGFNKQPTTNFGGNANLNSADFVYCFAD